MRGEGATALTMTFRSKVDAWLAVVMVVSSVVSGAGAIVLVTAASGSLHTLPASRPLK